MEVKFHLLGLRSNLNELYIYQYSQNTLGHLRKLSKIHRHRLHELKKVVEKINKNENSKGQENIVNQKTRE